MPFPLGILLKLSMVFSSVNSAVALSNLSVNKYPDFLSEWVKITDFLSFLITVFSFQSPILNLFLTILGLVSILLFFSSSCYFSYILDLRRYLSFGILNIWPNLFFYCKCICRYCLFQYVLFCRKDSLFLIFLLFVLETNIFFNFLIIYFLNHLLFFIFLNLALALILFSLG